jgi:hypothetical protein
MDALLIPTFLCPKAWESMSGTDKERHCSYCNKSVHNLAAMTARERLALLSSPAASICSRYRVAIRRPAKGRETAYHRHLLKYGAGVALSGSVILVLWEMHGQTAKDRYYRATGVTPGSCAMPPDLFNEHQTFLLGMVVPQAESINNGSEANGEKSDDLTIDPREIDKLFPPVDSPPEGDRHG